MTFIKFGLDCASNHFTQFRADFVEFGLQSIKIAGIKFGRIIRFKWKGKLNVDVL